MGGFILSLLQPRLWLLQCSFRFLRASGGVLSPSSGLPSACLFLISCEIHQENRPPAGAWVENQRLGREAKPLARLDVFQDKKAGGLSRRN